MRPAGGLSTRLVLGRPARWAASVRGKFFCRSPADVSRREGRRFADRSRQGPLRARHAPALAGSRQSGIPKSNLRSPVSGQPAASEPHRQSLDRGPFRRSPTFAHLLVGQEPTGKAVCPFIVGESLSVWRSMPPTLASKRRGHWRGSQLVADMADLGLESHPAQKGKPCDRAGTSGAILPANEG